MYDYLIVGAGYAGSVLAERLARDAGKKVLICDRRPHVGGQRLRSSRCRRAPRSQVRPAHLPHELEGDLRLPLAVHRMARLRASRPRLCRWPAPAHPDQSRHDQSALRARSRFRGTGEILRREAERVEKIETSEDVVVNTVGRELYEKFFRGYTRKQWGLDPSELSSQVTARIPTRRNRDDRYFTDAHQAMPLHGFTKMFENMLDHENITIQLSTDYRDIKDSVPYREMIYTGPIDEFFDFRYGKLPYRSLEFRHETHDVEKYQDAPVVNYPTRTCRTRASRSSNISPDRSTTRRASSMSIRARKAIRITRSRGRKTPRSTRKYQALVNDTPGLYFVGRLASYKYYNMDQVVGQALTLYRKIRAKEGAAAAVAASAVS
jgi:UDP-galactopyranose mutase